MVQDLHGRHLFTVVRSRRDAAYERALSPHDADPILGDEVIRRLEEEDWEMNAVYRFD